MKNTLLLVGAGLMCGLAVNAAAPAPELPCRWERLNLDGGGYIGRIVTDPNRAGRVYCLSDKGGIHGTGDDLLSRFHGYEHRKIGILSSTSKEEYP